MEEFGLDAEAAAQRVDAELDYYRRPSIAVAAWYPRVFYRQFCISLANRQGLLVAIPGFRAAFAADGPACRRALAAGALTP